MSSQLVNPPSILLAAGASRPVTQDPLWRRAALRVWQSLETMGNARASSELQRLAMLRQASDPHISRMLRQTAAELAGR
jgi:hypothetical protein